MRSSIARRLLIGLGFLFVGFGAVGVVLPLVPTTPFLLVAAWAFAQASPRFHRWLLGSPVFGRMLRRWNRDRCVSRRVKVLALTMLVVVLGSSLIFFVDRLLIRVVMGLVGAVGAAVVLSLRTCPPGPASEGAES